MSVNCGASKVAMLSREAAPRADVGFADFPVPGGEKSRQYTKTKTTADIVAVEKNTNKCSSNVILKYFGHK